MRPLPWLELGLSSLVFSAALVSCSSDSGDSSNSENTGGKSGSGGNSSVGGKAGTGGASATGGAPAGKGGSASGGSKSAGGMNAGGDTATGGRASGGEAGSGETGGSGTGGGSAGGSGGNPPVGECGAVTTFEDGLAPERELFVDADAAGPGDGSAADPFNDLEAALGEATPGTAVRLRPGTYPGGAFASDVTGTEAAPIWLGGVPGEERPVISGGANAIQLSSASYLVLHDLEVTGQESNGLNIDDGGDAASPSSNLIFRNLLIHTIGSGGNQDCLKLSGVDSYVVRDSEFRGCSGGSAIDQVGCHDGRIFDNVFRDLGGNGVQTKGGSARIEITRNRFLAAGERAVNMGGSTGFEFFRAPLSGSMPNFEAREIVVTANLFRGGTSPVAFVGCVDCLAANNTIVDPIRWVVRILQETTSTAEYEFLPAMNGRFVNNIVYFDRSLLSTYVNVGAETAPETFEFSNNLWYAHDDPAQSEPDGLPVTESGGVYGENPNLFDAAADEVRITIRSPAARAGASVSEVSADLAGNCFQDPPAIGAMEAP